MTTDLRGIRIAITGANGFIGLHLVRALVKLGAEIYALVDPGNNLERLKKLGVTSVVITQWDKKTLQHILAEINPAGIIHLRARINQTNAVERDLFFHTNFENTKELAEAALTLKHLKTFLRVGTIAEYGGSPAPFNEEIPGQPISDYGKSKLAATLWLKELQKKHSFPLATVRLSLVYGSGQSPHSYLIPNVIKSCLEKKNFYISSNGNQTRDPLFIDDAVEGLVLAFNSREAHGEIINMGLGKEHTVLAIAECINEILGNPIAVKTGGQPNRLGENDHYWNDIRKAKRILGWSPTTSLTEGLKKTISWYKEHQSVFT
ncbi:MAG: dTDP-glucose 4,6-dehydratase [Candidatus Magasanikbacteria bacterium GW2011_GWA2_45_39]|uniref:dTDP-glucose 4,6-dehydratase n=1 Tax=Candidatus Magasanikbacteria bacterium GW2011_GWA2_45_39 TaxID=1619041 RepID=A0A0G1QGI6_9BACT|nr:MAG: dTDP-glucose 4,6-dehydratase [Candidatus Magasanikbacteria bacterium GW2011_GWA2_45_39]